MTLLFSTIQRIISRSFTSPWGMLVWLLVLFGALPWLGVWVIAKSGWFPTPVHHQLALMFMGLWLPSLVWLPMLVWGVSINPTIASLWGLTAQGGYPKFITAILIGLLAFAAWDWGIMALVAWLNAHGWHISIAMPQTPFEFINVSWRPILALTLVTLIPISEETLFRGGVQSTFYRFFNTTHPQIALWLSILGSASLFCLLHGAYWQSPLAMASTLGLGIGLALCRSWTDSIWPGVVLHSVNNALVIAGWWL